MNTTPNYARQKRLAAERGNFGLWIAMHPTGTIASAGIY